MNYKSKKSPEQVFSDCVMLLAKVRKQTSAKQKKTSTNQNNVNKAKKSGNDVDMAES